MKIFKENKSEIYALSQGESVEHDSNDPAPWAAYGGLGVFLVLFLLSFIVFVWAVVALVQNWKFLPTWAQVISILALMGPLGGPVVSLIVVYVARTNKGGGRSGGR